MNDNLNIIKEQIQIPKNIDLAIKEGIERGRKEKVNRKSRKYRKVATAAGIVGIMSIIGITNPNIVKAIPGVQSVFSIINHVQDGQLVAGFEKFSTSVNKTVEDKGIKVTINDITLDDNTLAITSTIEGKDLDERKGDMNGILLNNQAPRSFGYKAKKINDNKMVEVTYANVSEMKLTDNVNIELKYLWIGNTQGFWNFKFSVPKGDKNNNSKTIELNKAIKIPNATLELSKLVTSPLGNTIIYDGVYDKENKSQRNGIFDFAVIDDKGKMLDAVIAPDYSNTKKFEGKIQINSSLDEIKFITVVPIFKDYGEAEKDVDGIKTPVLQGTINTNDFNIPQETIVKSRPATKEEKSSGYVYDKVYHVYNIDRTREFVSIDKLINQSIKVSSSNNLVIKDISATDKYTKLTFKVEGNGAYSSRYLLDATILDENYNDIERAENGETPVNEDVNNRIISIMLPPIDKNKKYKIALPTVDNPEILDQYKVKIDLNK
ncbi:DUF4179 domain-containing protein [Clostridium manihotivorum]|uniref:DUF4179 domain-containing protein n=1 Tax=Clostridium manihotivorum TaxID=2320868 RepID=A0A3R5QTT8_9CLOT|nr:DUF4179 domain-containing protein [Clostridium manihotivorum]QAA32457.1 hypothetical protein C1I91_12855 [Clostridium manihotivorum]